MFACGSVHAVQIRDLLRLMGCEEDIIWRVLSEFVSKQMQKLPARRLSWWKDDSYPPAAIELDVMRWRQLPDIDKDVIKESARCAGGMFVLAPLVEHCPFETITNDT